MLTPAPTPPSRTTRIVGALQANLGRTLAVVGAVTALLVIPFLAMAPDESASTEPDRRRVHRPRPHRRHLRLDGAPDLLRRRGPRRRHAAGRAAPAAVRRRSNDCATIPISARPCSPTSRSTPPPTSPACSASPTSSTPNCVPPRASGSPTRNRRPGQGRRRDADRALRRAFRRVGLSTQTTQAPDGAWIVPAVSPDRARRRHRPRLRRRLGEPRRRHRTRGVRPRDPGRAAHRRDPAGQRRRHRRQPHQPGAGRHRRAVHRLHDPRRAGDGRR